MFKAQAPGCPLINHPASQHAVFSGGPRNSVQIHHNSNVYGTLQEAGLREFCQKCKAVNTQKSAFVFHLVIAPGELIRKLWKSDLDVLVIAPGELIRKLWKSDLDVV